MNPVASRVLKSATKPYEALEVAYMNADVAALRKEINAGMEIWDEVRACFLLANIANKRQDGNMSLVLALVDSIPGFHIISLAKRYASLPLSTIAAHQRVTIP